MPSVLQYPATSNTVSTERSCRSMHPILYITAVSLSCPGSATAPSQARLRIERRILFAAQCLPGELDEMVGNEADAEYGLDLASPQSIMDGAPERPAIIRQYPEIEHDPECHHRRTRKIGPSELAGSGRNQTVRESGIDLM